MSNVSGSSSSPSSTGPRGKGRVIGVPKRCWCGSSIWALISKSDPNPYMRYFRYASAASKKLINDEHTFKWVDEAVINEIEALQFTNQRLEKELKEIKTERELSEKMVFEKVQIQVEKEIFERVEAVLVESSSRVNKTMILVVIGCMIMVGLGKLLG